MYLWVYIHIDVNMCVYFQRKHINALQFFIVKNQEAEIDQ